MLELKISNADLLGRAVRPLIQRADAGIADYSPDEISLTVLAQKSSFTLRQESNLSNFGNNLFRCGHRGSVVVDLDEFQDHLGLGTT